MLSTSVLEAKMKKESLPWGNQFYSLYTAPADLPTVADRPLFDPEHAGADFRTPGQISNLSSIAKDAAPAGPDRCHANAERLDWLPLFFHFTSTIIRLEAPATRASSEVRAIAWQYDIF
jgi:hypothetical protein